MTVQFLHCTVLLEGVQLVCHTVSYLAVAHTTSVGYTSSEGYSALLVSSYVRRRRQMVGQLSKTRYTDRGTRRDRNTASPGRPQGTQRDKNTESQEWSKPLLY